MNKKDVIVKWLTYLILTIVLTAIAGDFGMLAALVLIFMLQ